VCVVCGVGSGLCAETIIRPEEFYRARVCVCVFVCGLETSTVSLPRPVLGCYVTEKNKYKSDTFIAY